MPFKEGAKNKRSTRRQFYHPYLGVLDSPVSTEPLNTFPCTVGKENFDAHARSPALHTAQTLSPFFFFFKAAINENCDLKIKMVMSF